MNKKYTILSIIVAVIFTTVILSHFSRVSTLLRNNKKITGVVIGTDWVDYSIHSDTIIFFCYNPATKILDMISIPRDTKIANPEHRFRRINEIYAHYYKEEKNFASASTQLLNTVTQIFNNELVPDYYIQINYDLFCKFIDSIGGVKIEITEPMHYDDNAGKLHIHFEPGIYKLNGKKSLEYVRYRSYAGDIGRIYRQQRFIRAVMYKLVNPLYTIRIPFILNFFIDNIHTNLSVWDIINLSFEFKNINLKQIRMAQLPGKPVGMLWVKNDNEISRIINLINGTPVSNISTGSIALPDKQVPVRVQVFNASSRKGMALEITDLLRKKQFDVIDWGNYAAPQKKSIIIDRVGNLPAAQKIAKILNIDEIITRYDSRVMVDVTVIIGEDYRK